MIVSLLTFYEAAKACLMDKSAYEKRLSIVLKENNMSETRVIVIPEGKTCDYFDVKFRNDTSEEYVRHTIEKRLVSLDWSAKQ